MTTNEQRARTAAESMGHDVASDPPAAMTAARRWTCTRCGRAVLLYGSNVYGSATTNRCDTTPTSNEHQEDRDAHAAL